MTNFYSTPFWFAWNRLEDTPDLSVAKDFFRLLPNPPGLYGLEQDRGGVEAVTMEGRAPRQPDRDAVLGTGVWGQSMREILKKT